MPPSNVVRDHHHSGVEGSATKLLLTLSLIFTSIVTILLLCSDRGPWTNSGHLYDFVESNRASVQLIIGVLAGIFGGFNLYSICALINFSTRLRLFDTSHTLDHLGLWNALCSRRLDWSLPYRFSILLIIFWTLARIPGAIWIGALTPIETSSYSSTIRTLDTPKYNDTSRQYLASLDFTKRATAIHNPLGVFTYSPNYELEGLIVNQAGSATSYRNASQLQKKLDNTVYSYKGRSYGVGSSAGLTDQAWSSNLVLGYRYLETGYATTVSCKYNDTSGWKLDPTKQVYSNDGTYPYCYLVSGGLVNGGSDKYAACSLGSPDGIFALTGSSNPNSAEIVNAYAIATGKAYAAFNSTQCTVDFIPTNFAVSVNRTNSTIEVIPQDALDPAIATEDIDPTKSLVSITMRMLTSFSQHHACDVYTSLVGNTFQSNVQSTNPRFDAATNSTWNQSQTLRSVEDTLTSMLDNSLLAFSSAQLMIANDTTPAKATVSLSAVRIGKSVYIYILAGMNFAILLLCLVESIRTRNWTGLSKFDYSNIKDVIVSTSKGGSFIAEEAIKLQEGSKDRSEIGTIRVQSEGKGEDIKLVGVDVENDEEKGSRNPFRRKTKGLVGTNELKPLTTNDPPE